MSTRLSTIAAACCMAAALVSQDVNAQDYRVVYEQPSDDLKTLFIGQKQASNSGSAETGDAECTGLLDIDHPLGMVRGYSGNDECTKFNAQYAKFTCRALTRVPTTAPSKAPSEAPTTKEPSVSPTKEPTTKEPTKEPSASPTKEPSASPTVSPVDSRRRLDEEFQPFDPGYVGFQNPGCGFSSVINNPDRDPTKKCVELVPGSNNKNLAHVCEDITSGTTQIDNPNMDTMFLTSTTYGGRDDCADSRGAEAQEDMLKFTIAGKCTQVSNSNVHYINACPALGGAVTTLYKNNGCDAEDEIDADFDFETDVNGKAAYDSIIFAGVCDTTTHSIYDVCTMVSVTTLDPTKAPTRSPQTPEPTDAPQTPLPSVSPSPKPTDAPATPAPSTKPSTGAPNNDPTKRPTSGSNGDGDGSGAIVQGVTGDVLLAVAVATLALGAMA